VQQGTQCGRDSDLHRALCGVQSEEAGGLAHGIGARAVAVSEQAKAESGAIPRGHDEGAGGGEGAQEAHGLAAGCERNSVNGALPGDLRHDR